MRTLVAIALLPACLIAPDRPGGDILDPGALPMALTVGPSACLDASMPLEIGTVGKLPGGRNALFRSGIDPSSHLPRIYMITLAHPVTCYEVMVELPVPNAAVKALDIAVDAAGDGDDLVALLEDTVTGHASIATLTIANILSKAPAATLTAAGTSTYTLTSDYPTDDITHSIPETPRFIHRQPTGALWFGASPNIGIATLSGTSIDIPAPVAAVPTQAMNGLWLDAMPLVTPTAMGDTTVLIGDEQTASARAAAGAVMVDHQAGQRMDACDRESAPCPLRTSHLVTGDSTTLVGSTAAQAFPLGVSIPMQLEVILTDGSAKTALLADNGFIYGIDALVVAQNNAVDAVTLWYSNMLGQYRLDYYADILDAAGPNAPQGAGFTGEVTGTLQPTEIRVGAFSAPTPQILVLGATAGSFSCVSADSTFTPC